MSQQDSSSQGNSILAYLHKETLDGRAYVLYTWLCVASIGLYEMTRADTILKILQAG